ncbi:MAG: hypothetical protein WBR26_18440 [Candidatus Acidiferrum sp.]
MPASWIVGIRIEQMPLTTFLLLLIAGALLLCAAVLLSINRKVRVEIQHSLLTEELVAHLSRIATALEESRTPNSEEVAAHVLRRWSETSHNRASGKVRQMPSPSQR